MLLSFVILTFNSEKYIVQCIESIIRNTPKELQTEIYVVDNGSNDSTVCLLESKGAVKVIKLDRNYGTTYSRNLALKRSSGEYVVILDSDIKINNIDWTKILNTFNQQTGLIAPKLKYANGEIQHSIKKFPTLLQRLKKLFTIFGGIKTIDGELYANLQNIEYPDTAISAFWIIKREVLNVVGLLDEKIFYSPEDVDYCVRIWKKGYSIKYYLDADITHYTQQISHKKLLSKISISFLIDFFYYFIKHGYFFSTKKLDQIKKQVLSI